MCRKPGKQEAQAAERGVSVMQPMAAPTAPASTAAAQSASFDALAAEQVAPEDVFFHKFMTLDSVRRRAAVNRAKRKGKKARKQSEDGEGVLPDDSSSEGSDGDDSDAEDAFMDAIETMDVRLVHSLHLHDAHICAECKRQSASDMPSLQAPQYLRLR
jgi:hypothetical protein